MQKEIGHILKNKLAPLPFVDLLAGLAQTVTTTDKIDDGASIIKKFPVTYDATEGQQDCRGREIVLTPDSNKKSIIYLEDYGLNTMPTKAGGLFGFASSLRLVCWLNKSKLVGDPYVEISARCITSIVSLIGHKGMETMGIFTRLNTEITRIHPQDARLFGAYTYDETLRQYLRPPFEFFGIDLTSKFYVSGKCLDTISWNVEAC